MVFSSWSTTDLDAFYWRNSSSRFNPLSKAAITVIIFGVGIKVTATVINYLKKRRRFRYSLSNPDVVILHQFPRSATVPNLSPFVLKLETFLRLSNIKYENDFKDPMGPKGKCPYITLNGEDICDSQLAIEYLNSFHNIDLDNNLSDTEKAISHALRIMLENNLYWVVVLYRYIYDGCKCLMKVVKGPLPLKYALLLFIPFRIQRQAYMHGIGRHTEAQVRDMGKKDLLQLSNFLGDKKFLFGNKPSEVDCAAFGILAQIMWTLPGTALEEYLESDTPNLRQYCLRMKAEVWPDWDQSLYPKK